MTTCRQCGKLPATRRTFSNSYLGLVMVVLMFAAVLLLGMQNPRIFVDARNLANVAGQTCYSGLLALAVALTARAKGPDISAGAQMALSTAIISRSLATSGSPVAGALIAIAVCAAAGAINGVFAVYLKVPALAISGGMYLVIILLCRVLSAFFRSSFAAASPQSFTLPSWVPYALLLTAFAAVFLLTMLTRLRRSIYSREKAKAPIFVLAYALSGVLAALAAILWHADYPSLALSPGNYTLLLPFFIAGFIVCSRLFDNGFMPAIMALLGTILWAFLQNAMNLSNIAGFYQIVAACILIAAFGGVASAIWFSQHKAAKAVL